MRLDPPTAITPAQPGRNTELVRDMQDEPSGFRDRVGLAALLLKR